MDPSSLHIIPSFFRLLNINRAFLLVFYINENKMQKNKEKRDQNSEFIE
jgi:hypothetical protein